MAEPIPPSTQDNVFRQVLLDVIATVAPETRGRAIDDDADLRVVFELDSMDMLSVMRGLKERLGVEVPAAEASRLFTLASAVRLLKGLVS
jgi:acyl carrier protein